MEFVPKQIYNEISEQLTYLRNSSFIKGIFLKFMKFWVIKPIYKQGDKPNINNYKPIPENSKIMSEFITKYKRLSDYQFGFRKRESTEDAIDCLVEKSII